MHAALSSLKSILFIYDIVLYLCNVMCSVLLFYQKINSRILILLPFKIYVKILNCSGVQVMGIVSNGACSKYVRATPELLWPVPRHWTMEEASTVPLPYAHAFYCLVSIQNNPHYGTN